MGLNISFWMIAGRNRKQIHKGVSAFLTYIAVKKTEYSLLGDVYEFVSQCAFILQ